MRPILETTVCRSRAGDNLPDDVFHLFHIVVSEFDARAGGSLDVDHELARRRCAGKRKRPREGKRDKLKTEDSQKTQSDVLRPVQALRTHRS